MDSTRLTCRSPALALPGFSSTALTAARKNSFTLQHRSSRSAPAALLLYAAAQTPSLHHNQNHREVRRRPTSLSSSAHPMFNNAASAPKLFHLTLAILLSFAVPLLGPDVAVFRTRFTHDAYLFFVNLHPSFFLDEITTLWLFVFLLYAIRNVEFTPKWLAYRTIHYLVSSAIPFCIWGELSSSTSSYYTTPIPTSNLLQWLPSCLTLGILVQAIISRWVDAQMGVAPEPSQGDQEKREGKCEGADVEALSAESLGRLSLDDDEEGEGRVRYPSRWMMMWMRGWY